MEGRKKRKKRDGIVFLLRECRSGKVVGIKKVQRCRCAGVQQSAAQRSSVWAEYGARSGMDQSWKLAESVTGAAGHDKRAKAWL